MARHAIPRTPVPRTPVARRALAVLATASAALGAGAAAAFAAPAQPAAPGGVTHTRPAPTDAAGPRTGLEATAGTVRHVAGPVAGLRPNPLAGTGADPLDNGVGTQVADFKPLDSRTVTGPVTQAPSVGGVPAVGRAAGLLGG
ncbi:hypothetical protein SUDANB6_02259 [Streptomyces sp. enrichment culture]|uniref:hypothetical protein n=1 Tax=Streptomyces sp. enrichment culture TaxID=1795815 RepID=UPI003F551202